MNKLASMRCLQKACFRSSIAPTRGKYCRASCSLPPRALHSPCVADLFTGRRTPRPRPTRRAAAAAWEGPPGGVRRIADRIRSTLSVVPKSMRTDMLTSPVPSVRPTAPQPEIKPQKSQSNMRYETTARGALKPKRHPFNLFLPCSNTKSTPQSHSSPRCTRRSSTSLLLFTPCGKRWV